MQKETMDDLTQQEHGRRSPVDAATKAKNDHFVLKGDLPHHMFVDWMDVLCDVDRQKEGQEKLASCNTIRTVSLEPSILFDPDIQCS